MYDVNKHQWFHLEKKRKKTGFSSPQIAAMNTKFVGFQPENMLGIKEIDRLVHPWKFNSFLVASHIWLLLLFTKRSFTPCHIKRTNP